MADTPAFWIKTEDWHTAGEPFRIVPELPEHCTSHGAPVAERRLNILKEPNHPVDLLRRSLCHEPRGHADMYGCFIVPPNDPGAHFGVLFFHRDGFSTACGHGTIALGRWAVSHGIISSIPDGTVKVIIDVPSGRVAAHVVFEHSRVSHVDFINVHSYQFAADVPVSVNLRGEEIDVKLDLSWGGATYASVCAADLALHVEPRNHQLFIDLARQIKTALGAAADHRDTGLYGVCFFETLSDTQDTLTQKNVVVFADGQIDRSPCGSGTGARVAVLLAKGDLSPGKKLVHKSIIDTVFEASVVEYSREEGKRFPSCIPMVKGNAALTGRHEFWIDPGDVTFPGFLFR